MVFIGFLPPGQGQAAHIVSLPRRALAGNRAESRTWFRAKKTRHGNWKCWRCHRPMAEFGWNEWVFPSKMVMFHSYVKLCESLPEETENGNGFLECPLMSQAGGAIWIQDAWPESTGPSRTSLLAEHPETLPITPQRDAGWWWKDVGWRDFREDHDAKFQVCKSQDAYQEIFQRKHGNSSFSS